MTTDYRLCIYNGAGTLILNLSAPAGGMCGTKPCWKATRTGFKYKNKTPVPLNSLTALTLASGPDGKAKVGASSKGTTLTIPGLPLNQTTPVRAQLINSFNSTCFESIYSAPANSRPGDTLKWKDKND